MRALTVLVAGAVMAVLVAGLAPAIVAAGLVAGATDAGSTSPAGSSTGTGSITASGAAEIPAAMLALYRRAATTCPGLSWSVLAAIGTVESDNDQSTLPGVHSGANFAGAEGPMQFEPATFASYDQPIPPGGVDPPSPYDPTDAVYAAARYLCANGAGDQADLSAAVFTYNHSAAYVAHVLGLARSYAQAGSSAQGRGTSRAPATAQPVGGTAGAVGELAMAWALAQVGTPYVWGGETSGVGFDCSGLVQAAYRAVGVALPRVAQDQFDAGPHLVPDAPLEPGDLVFFGQGPQEVTHVGIDVGTEDGRALMVDAPHTGAEVRVEAFPNVVGSAWGDERYIGATRPA